MAGERAANFLTLVSSALRNDLDVYAYLKSVLDALLTGSTDYAPLRPDTWATAHPEAIRAYHPADRRHRYARNSPAEPIAMPVPQVTIRSTWARVTLTLARLNCSLKSQLNPAQKPCSQHLRTRPFEWSREDTNITLYEGIQWR